MHGVLYKKRERCENFTKEEVDLLVNLVIKYKDIIVTTKSDAYIWAAKDACWKKIESEFNRTSKTTYRTHITLRAKYETLKKATRRKVTLLPEPSLEPYEKKLNNALTSSVKASREDDSDMIKKDPDLPADLTDDEYNDNKTITNTIVEIPVESFDATDPLDQPMCMPGRNRTADVITNFEQESAERIDSEHTESSQSECSIAERFANSTSTTDNTRKRMQRRLKEFNYRGPPTLKTRKLPSEEIAETKLQLVEIQKRILLEELKSSRAKWAFEEHERKHKRRMWALERQYLIAKIKNEKNKPPSE